MAPGSRVAYTRDNANVQHLIGFIDHGSRVLDVGCASGYVARALVQKGCEVIGVEPDPVAAAAARDACSDLIVGSIDDAEVLSRISSHGPYDAILAADVLEHLANPLTTVKTLAPLVADHGRLVVSLPNIAFIGMRFRLLSGRFNYTPTGLLDETHLKFFTLRSAQHMLERGGFVVTIAGGQPGRMTGNRVRRYLLGRELVRAYNAIGSGLARARPQLFGYQLLLVAELAHKERRREVTGQPAGAKREPASRP